ncbi:hypothetical protein AVEN_166643-1 [Araneus ventricosus]|uniref:Uncharacterized protein n=1 Tax=Araneus ventricosus TaxID=182803 RepID=A0A4Y2E068_ARAVE|nr:hypothetical protein AVEN_166643-1 [Araneus ventricosus]
MMNFHRAWERSEKQQVVDLEGVSKQCHIGMNSPALKSHFPHTRVTMSGFSGVGPTGGRLKKYTRSKLARGPRRATGFHHPFPRCAYTPSSSRPKSTCDNRYREASQWETRLLGA